MNAHHNTTVLLEFYINTEYFTINMFWKKKKQVMGGENILVTLKLLQYYKNILSSSSYMKGNLRKLHLRNL